MKTRRLEIQITMLKWLTSLILMVGIGASATLAQSPSSNQGEFHQTYDLAPGGTVSVTNISGYIRITSWDENRVRVDAVKRGSATDGYPGGVQVSATQSVIVIRAVIGQTSGTRTRDWGGDVDIDLKVPRTAILNPITMVSGEVRVVGPVAQLTVRSQSGAIEARDVKGPTSLTTSSGALVASGIGTPNADSVLISLSGAITVERAIGRITARSTSGNVTVTDSDGDVAADSTASTVVVDRARGRVNATSQAGKVVVRNVQQGANARAVAGSIEITGAKGRIVATTIGGSIVLNGVDSRDVQARSTNGSVNFDGQISPEGRYAFESFSGSISLVIPADSQFNLTATSHNGSINTEFPIRVEGGNLGAERQLRGTAGQGGAEIIATGFNGRIEIKKRR